MKPLPPELVDLAPRWAGPRQRNVIDWKPIAHVVGGTRPKPARLWRYWRFLVLRLRWHRLEDGPLDGRPRRRGHQVDAGRERQHRRDEHRAEGQPAQEPGRPLGWGAARRPIGDRPK